MDLGTHYMPTAMRSSPSAVPKKQQWGTDYTWLNEASNMTIAVTHSLPHDSRSLVL